MTQGELRAGVTAERTGTGIWTAAPARSAARIAKTTTATGRYICEMRMSVLRTCCDELQFLKGFRAPAGERCRGPRCEPAGTLRNEGRVRFYVVALCVIALTGCSPATSALPSGGAGAGISRLGHGRPSSATFTSLYTFRGGSDGAYPRAGVAIGSTLYGTTYYGDEHDGGTVFAISTSGAERLLYSFRDEADGANPSTPLTEADGALYGTTEADPGCCSTIFRLRNVANCVPSTRLPVQTATLRGRSSTSREHYMG